MECKILPSKTFLLVGLSLIFAWSMGQEIIREYSIKGVVDSPISLRCPAPADANVETVSWRSGTPADIVYVIYVIKDNHYAEVRSGYNIINDTTLFISSLKREDSRTFVSKMLSVKTDEFMSCVVHLKVLVGCELWNYTSPLQSSSKGCSTGGLVHYNATCTFACDAGFRLEGTSSIQCLANGELSSTLPKCEAIPCTLPHFPSNLRSSKAACANGSHVEYLTECDVYCDAGYQLVGNNSVTCLASGKFDNPLPACEVQKSMSQGALVAVIFAVFLAIGLISIGIGVLITKQGGCRRNHRAGQDKPTYNVIPLEVKQKNGDENEDEDERDLISKQKDGEEDEDEKKRDNISKQEDGDEDEDEDERDFINWMENYIQLFTDQLPTESKLCNTALHKVLQTLQVLENNLISSLQSSIPFKHKYTSIQKTKTSTEREALALYTGVVISFTEDWSTKWRLENKIIHLLSDEESTLSSVGSSLKPSTKYQQIDGYLEIIHSFFARFITSYHDMLAGEKRRHYITKITAVIRLHGNAGKRYTPAVQKNNEGKHHMQSHHLTELCMHNINALEKIEGKINLRQKILEAIFLDNKLGF